MASSTVHRPASTTAAPAETPLAARSSATRPPLNQHPVAKVPTAAASTAVTATATTAQMIQLVDVSKQYRQGGSIKGGLTNVSLEVPRGEFLWVVGASGSGKTTLLKLLYGAERPTQGQVWVNQQEISRLKGDRISRFRRQLGIVFQDYKLLPNRTVAENIAFVLWAQGCTQGEVQRRLKPTLQLVGLGHKAESFPGELSGGEQQRVSIARAIVSTPPLLIADEPTGNLDAENAQQVVNLLNQLNRMGVTVVVTTHNQGLVDASSHPVVQIHHGQLRQLRG